MTLEKAVESNICAIYSRWKWWRKTIIQVKLTIWIFMMVNQLVRDGLHLVQMTWMMNQPAISIVAAGMFVLVLLFQDIQFAHSNTLQWYCNCFWHFSCLGTVKPNFFIFLSEVYVSLLSCVRRSHKVLCQHTNLRIGKIHQTLWCLHHQEQCVVLII